MMTLPVPSVGQLLRSETFPEGPGQPFRVLSTTWYLSASQWDRKGEGPGLPQPVAPVLPVVGSRFWPQGAAGYWITYPEGSEMNGCP